MIPLQTEHIFTLYFAVWFFVIAAMWFFDELRKRKTYQDSVVKERLYFCGNCHFIFMAKTDSEHITRCPRCNEMCFLKKRKRF